MQNKKLGERFCEKWSKSYKKIMEGLLENPHWRICSFKIKFDCKHLPNPHFTINNKNLF